MGKFALQLFKVIFVGIVLSACGCETQEERERRERAEAARKESYSETCAIIGAVIGAIVGAGLAWESYRESYPKPQ